MPAELFRTVAVRRSSTARRFGAVPLSVAIHAAVLVAAVTIPLFATDVLPMPQVPLVVRIPSMPAVAVPTVPRPRSPRPALDLPTLGAPVVAPLGVAPPSGIEPMPRGLPDMTLGELPGSISNAGQLVTDSDFVPPPPPPGPAAPVRASTLLQPPRKIHDCAPVYPQVAIAAHVEGTVFIEATISTAGTVQNVRVLRSAALLDQAALDAVREWVFTPTLLNGVAVPVVLTVNVEFKLR